MGTSKALVRAMADLIGLGETPRGSNKNRVTIWYNREIARIGFGPWCDQAVTYAAARSGNLMAVYGGHGKGYAYTVTHAREFQKHGRWHSGTKGVQPGDVIFYDWTGQRSIDKIDHVGVVEKVRGGVIYTIEANVSNVCMRMARDGKYVVGYGRPDFAKNDTKPVGVHAPSGYPILRQGSTGERVKQLQRALMKAGMQLPQFGADGDFGQETGAALGAFQKIKGLLADREYGPDTAKALKKVVG